MPDVLIAAASNDVVAWYENRLASAMPFGNGCGNAPLTHQPTTRPALGTSAQASVGNVPGQLCILVAGLDRTNHPWFGSLPFDLAALGMPGCSLLQSAEVPGVLAVPTPNPGVFTWNMPLPNSVAFAGLSFYTQAFALAPAANPQGIVASNGIAWRLGS
jgi:hypothetical protein